MQVPEVVRAARRAGGLSQRALAARLGVSASTVSAWEAGTREPTFATIAGMLASVDRDLAVTSRPGEATPQLRSHLRHSLTTRLRLALGEPPSPFVRATGPAWLGLLALGRLGTVVLRPPVATGIWLPIRPQSHVEVTVLQPSAELPVSPAVSIQTGDTAPPASLVPVCVVAPVRVWVLPPAELLLEETAQLQQAAALLHEWSGRDAAGRRGPAHRDPDEWDEDRRMLRTKGTERLERPMPELSRAWRLGGPVSLAQAVHQRPR